MLLGCLFAVYATCSLMRWNRFSDNENKCPDDRVQGAWAAQGLQAVKWEGVHARHVCDARRGKYCAEGYMLSSRKAKVS